MARYTYSPGYIDSPAVQERDLNSDGDFGDSDEVVYYHSNTLHSIYALTDGSENVVERYRYNAYGACTVLDVDWSTDADAASDAENPYRFTARRLDAESALMQYRNRYYSVVAGRFISRDPGGYIDGANLYVYTGGSPTTVNDPSGMKREEEWRKVKGKIEWNVRWITVRNWPTQFQSMDEVREYMQAPDDVSLPPLTEKKRVSEWVDYSYEVHMWCNGLTPHIGGHRNWKSNAKGLDTIPIGVPIKGIWIGYKYKRWAVCKKTNGWTDEPQPDDKCRTAHEIWQCRSYVRHTAFASIAPPIEGEWPKKGKKTGEETHHLRKRCCCPD